MAARRYRIQALDRAAAILNCFDANDQELNVRDVGERTGLHKSTAHRILMALQHNGFVEQNPVRETLPPGPAKLASTRSRGSMSP